MHVLYRKDGKLSWYFTMLSKGQKKRTNNNPYIKTNFI